MSGSAYPAGADPPGARSGGVEGVVTHRRQHQTPAMRRRTRTASPASTVPTWLAPVDPYRSETWWLVGTTTMRLGVTRHGPPAPVACQFGKYDTLTRTGVPVRPTSKLTDCPARWTCDTVVGGT